MLTPVDLETTVFQRGFRGYNTREVQEFMKSFGQDYERLYRDNIDLKEKIEELQKKLSQYQSIEDTLRNTMILAEETAEEAKNSAKQRADLVIREAEQRAEIIKIQLKEDIQNELHNLSLLKNQVEYFKCQFKSFLSGLLEMAEKQLDLNIVWDQKEENMAAATLEKEIVPKEKEISPKTPEIEQLKKFF